MDIAIVLTRAVHFASVISLAGEFAFVAFVSAPAFLQSGPDLPSGSHAYRRDLIRISWLSLIAALISGGFWLLLEARNMSGRGFIEALADGVVSTVLASTHFGHVWLLRFVLFGFLLLCVAFGGRPRFAPLSDKLRSAALLLSAALLATLAGAGHAEATPGWKGDLHLAADAAHLVAAGAWIGALLPLAVLLAHARRAGDLPWARVADDGIRRFSALGIASVLTLLVTGIVNTWFLAGSIPAIVGTDYGRLLLVKLAIFVLLLGFAVVNRQILSPRISADPIGETAVKHWTALGQLQRNAVIEIVLGAAVLAIVAVLGTVPPGAHTEPLWPFPYRLSLEAVEALPDLRNKVVAAAAVALSGWVLIVFGLWRGRRGWRATAVGAALFLGVGWLPLKLMAVPAYPSSFFVSPVPVSTSSIMRGARIYADNCVSCHGADGRGDGPGAGDLKIPAADLTAEHVFGHSDGELFWWIEHGMADGVMPGFAGVIDERDTWSLINFIHARAAGVQSSDMGAEVTGFPAPTAPDFTIDTPEGAQTTLRSQLAHGPVLLVFFSDPESRERLSQLAQWRSRLAEIGLTIIAVPVASGQNGEPVPDFVAATAADVPQTYALFERHARTDAAPAPAKHMEFLIDRNGYLRARWYPGDAPDWSDGAVLEEQMRRMARLPLAPIVHTGHVH